MAVDLAQTRQNRLRYQDFSEHREDDTVASVPELLSVKQRQVLRFEQFSLSAFVLCLLSGHRSPSNGRRVPAHRFAGEFIQQGLVAFGAKQVAGVQVSFPPGFFGGLGQLPVVEPRAETLAHRLVLAA